MPAWLAPGHLRDLARAYWSAGLSCIPLDLNRVPLCEWSPWRFVRQDQIEVDGLPWDRAAGIAILTGVDHGIVVLDADSDSAWRWLRGNLPGTRGTQTRRGGHVYFRHPVRGVITSHCGKGAIAASGVALDVKGTPGYVVAPFSKREGGFVYQPLGDWTCSIEDLPVLPEHVAALARVKVRPPAPPAPPRRPGNEPEKALLAYIAKRGGVPEEGCGSDSFVFEAAAWCKTGNAAGITEAEFVFVIRQSRPEFAEPWILSKWRSARGAS